MEKRISFRHNVMKIDSIEMFLSVRGGLNRNVRDVYFVRGIGESQEFASKIIQLENRINSKKDNMSYLRIESLPSISSSCDLGLYLENYERWHKGELISLKNGNMDPLFANTLSNALAEISALFTYLRKNVSDTIIKNFLVKLLFWLDNTVYEYIVPWNEKKSMKIVADNIINDQEYLFYYMLTYLGCDVLLIQNRRDIESAELKKISHEIKIGDFGTTNITAYIKKTDELRASGEVKKRENETTEKKRIPGKSTKDEHPSKVNVHTRKENDNSSAEKTFEELAQLAASIVLIAVHDRNGKVIGTGSGIMVGRNGFILTNNHVVAGGVYYSIRIEDDDEVYSTDEVIKYNSTTDLAVIRIQRTLNPIPIYSRNKKLVRGQKVVAIGSPLGLFNSVSDGIISGFRIIDGVEMIQFTAPTSHGSSGGAVLNMQGEVVGISTAGIDSGQNINLAIGYENILVFAKGFLDQ